MLINVTPEKAISFVRFITYLVFCWPPSSAATKSQVLRFKIMRFAMFINASMLLLALAYSLYLHNDFVNVAKAVSRGFAMIHIIVVMFYCASQYNNFQRLIEEMVAHIQDAKPAEMCVFQSYVDNYSIFYVASCLVFSLATIVVVPGCLFARQPFPTNAEYPFSVDYEPIKTIIFLHQALAGYQTLSMTYTNVLFALLIFFAAARLTILTLELRDVVDIGNFTELIKKYYRVRRYAQDVADTVQFMALLTVTVSGLGVLLGGIAVVGGESLAVKIQFIGVGVIGLLEVFMCAWPADELMQASQNVDKGAYESMWYERSVKMQKLTLCTMMPQQAIIISNKCVMPIMSLRYFCSYISNIFSFFTALRVMMTDTD